jgi:hypothetical protein
MTDLSKLKPDEILRVILKNLKKKEKIAKRIIKSIGF